MHLHPQGNTQLLDCSRAARVTSYAVISCHIMSFHIHAIAYAFREAMQLVVDSMQMGVDSWTAYTIRADSPWRTTLRLGQTTSLGIPGVI